MSVYQKNRIEYIVMCVFEFAHRNGISVMQAIDYLTTYDGVQYLQEFYDIEHTLPLNDTMDALIAICNRNGGGLT